MKKFYFLLLALGLFGGVEAQIINFPDANFKAKLLAASPSNTIAKNLAGDYFKIDADSDGEIQVSEAANVSELNLSNQINSVVGITNFSNLTKLNLSYNRIVNLNITGMQYLTFIDCSNNSQYLTSLTIENLPLLETLDCRSAGSNTSTPFYSLLNLPTLKTIKFGNCKFYTNTLDNLTALENIYGYAGLKSTVTSLNLSNKPNLKIVELDNNRLATLTLIPNNIIETLKLSGNNLISFDKTLFTNLKILDLSWNRMASLDVSNMTSLLELNCDNACTSFSYYFTSLNVQSCTNLQKLICSRNDLTNLNLSDLTNLVYLDCSVNNNVSTHTGLQAINLKNCISLKDVIVNNNYYLTELDLSCSNNYNQIRAQNCDILQRINLKDGADESTMYAGVFGYYGCPNLTLIGVDFNENFSFLPASIQQSPYYNFIPNCSYNTVLGNVKFDIEGDGCQNNVGIEGIKINYNSSIPNCFTFSDSQGNFTLYTQSSSISLAPENNPFPLFDFGLTGPIVLNFTPSNIVEHVNLCLAPNTVYNDIEITVVPVNFARPGFDANYKIIFKNKGNQIESGLVNFTFDDAIMDLIASNPIAANVSTNNLQWNFSNFLPFETREVDLTFNVNSPTEMPPVLGGTILNYSATIAGLLLDENPDDNISILNQTVVNSFDPNNKICLEGVNISQDAIGKYVHYVINFENNGTANAQNIVVRDIIDPSKFEISTLTPIGSSHNVNSRIINNNEVEFIFENINLPFDDANNDGYVAFKIKTKPTLVLGNTFSNTASIYFDYNFPIVTNTATTTIAALSVQDFEFSNYFSLYPNPVHDVLNISAKESIEISSISIYNTLGQLVLVIPNAKDMKTVDVSGLTSGHYFIKVHSDKGTSNTKFIKN